MSKISTALLAISIIIAGTLPACKKSSDPAPAPTAGMGGVRNWHRHHYYSANGPHFTTPIHEDTFLTDTTFSLTVDGDKRVYMFGRAFLFSTTDTVKKVHYFGDAYWYYYHGKGMGIAYFYVKDSVVWCSGDIHSTSDYWESKDLCYTY